MQTTNKTLSPWVLSDNVNDTEGEPFKEFCIEDGKGDIVGFFTDENQARLIAAAPDLLAALENLVIRGLIKDVDNDHYDEVLEAISKAKGE